MTETMLYAPLASDDWVADHLDDSAVRLIEVSDAAEYGAGHLPGAVHWDWERDILGGFRLQPIAATTMEALLSRSGITPETTVVVYGDWPTLSYWLLKLFRHNNVRILDGGRDRWVAEGRPIAAEASEVTFTNYRVAEPDWSVRARHDEVRDRLGRAGCTVLDVRTVEEYRGEHMWPGKAPDYCQRAGHIPGAQHLGWDATTREDGTFLPVDELRELFATRGVAPDAEVIPYCTIGGRSSHVWFVLSQLLGYPRVRLYDGSWLEWAHLVDGPIER